MNYSLIIPVYKNQETIPELISVLSSMNQSLNGELEVVFVVDGSPDQSATLLQSLLPKQAFVSQLIILSRNFGSFSAIRVGLQKATGSLFAVMAADLQEPPELIEQFFESLVSNNIDVVIGTRELRSDPWFVRLTSKLFWMIYRKYIIPEMPKGGVDVFGCNLHFRNFLLQCEESHTSLVALIFWLGFRRKQIPYHRMKRMQGKSGWTFRKKINYLADSIFAFTDLPIKFILMLGFLGTGASLILSVVVSLAHFLGKIPLPGYTATVLMILFFGGINMLALGLIGSYTWRSYENTKRRPLAVVLKQTNFPSPSL